MTRESLHISTSPVCNNHCVFCNDGFRDHPGSREPGLSPGDVEDILQAYRGRINRVNFTSGEPTLNPDLFALIRMAKYSGYRHVGLTTNGRMLSYGAYALGLLRSGLTEINISIHGHTAAMHDGQTRARGSFEQTVRGIKSIRDLRPRYPVTLNLAVTLNKLNYRAFREILAFLRPFGANTIVINVVQPIRGKMTRHFNRLMPRYRDVALVIEGFFEEHPEWFFGQGPGGSRISVIDLPRCLAPGLLPVIGYGETRTVSGGEPGAVAGRTEMKTRTFRDNRALKQKRDRCGSCAHDAHCSGIYRAYLEKFGWGEFNPVPCKGEPGRTRPAPYEKKGI